VEKVRICGLISLVEKHHTFESYKHIAQQLTHRSTFSVILPFSGLTDGFKIDQWGYIWTSIPNGFAVIDTTNNEVICQILLGINTSNVAFGSNKNNGDVWLTGEGGIWRVQRKIQQQNDKNSNKKASSDDTCTCTATQSSTTTASTTKQEL